MKIAKLGKSASDAGSVNDSATNNTAVTASSANHLEFKPNYLVQENMKGGVKYFFCILYMPESCKEKLRKVNP